MMDVEIKVSYKIPKKDKQNEYILKKETIYVIVRDIKDFASAEKIVRNHLEHQASEEIEIKKMKKVNYINYITTENDDSLNEFYNVKILKVAKEESKRKRTYTYNILVEGKDIDNARKLAENFLKTIENEYVCIHSTYNTNINRVI